MPDTFQQPGVADGGRGLTGQGEQATREIGIPLQPFGVVRDRRHDPADGDTVGDDRHRERTDRAALEQEIGDHRRGRLPLVERAVVRLRLVSHLELEALEERLHVRGIAVARGDGAHQALRVEQAHERAVTVDDRGNRARQLDRDLFDRHDLRERGRELEEGLGGGRVGSRGSERGGRVECGCRERRVHVERDAVVGEERPPVAIDRGELSVVSLGGRDVDDQATGVGGRVVREELARQVLRLVGVETERVDLPGSNRCRVQDERVCGCDDGVRHGGDEAREHGVDALGGDDVGDGAAECVETHLQSLGQVLEVVGAQARVNGLLPPNAEVTF